MSRHNATERARPRLTYANVMSTLAVFIVLCGGTALAMSPAKGAKSSRDSVTSATVRNGSLLSADLKDGAGVAGADVADGSLTGADLADGSVSGAKVADGSLGGADLADHGLGPANLAPGSVGPEALAAGSIDGSKLAPETITGREVRKGQLSVSEASRLGGKTSREFASREVYERFSTGPPVKSADGTISNSAHCDTGDILVAGGFLEAPPTATLVEDFPDLDGSWTVRINPNGAAGATITAQAVCLQQSAIVNK